MLYNYVHNYVSNSARHCLCPYASIKGNTDWWLEKKQHNVEGGVGGRGVPDGTEYVCDNLIIYI